MCHEQIGGALTCLLLQFVSALHPSPFQNNGSIFFSPPGLLQHVLIPALCSRLLDGCFPLLPSSIWASSSIPTFLSCSHAFSSSPACVLFLFGQCFFKVLHREHHSSFFAHGCSSFAPLIIMLPLHSISAGSRTCCCYIYSPCSSFQPK
ncbi:hypothetical protein VIGAN_06024200 [Vigna angularis var. angularis]|uniref:Secreted protein n=1 Tax=Vigna angularis var. angularis TaxID=157739 RepID=A0A0S3S8Z9_PHAAN|nr:hypothetical protein VIGAN_06024200 [Vigna angularis var. angularis]